IPCYGMKHFFAEYISPYPYTSGFSAVVIAKYYEGAYINGTLQSNNTPLPYAQVIIFDKYGIPHDIAYADENGAFHLIAPAGNITLQFSYDAGDGRRVNLKDITFNSTDDLLFSPITEQEATRIGNYTREINISVDLAAVDGFVYEDNNNNDSYEPEIDTPLSGVTVQLNDEFFGRAVQPVTTDANGHYQVMSLFPSQYTIIATQDGFDIHSNSVSVPPGTMFYNMSKPQLAGVEGTVTDPSGNTVNEADVTLRYSKDNKNVGTMITDAQGHYAFSKLVPGEYILNVTVTNSITPYYDYVFEDIITLEENKTLFSNVTLDYAAITVQGYTKYETQNIVNMSIEFSPDESVVNNSAEYTSTTSDIYTGVFGVSLQPGYYNISIYQTVNESGQDVTYTYEGNIVTTRGEGIKTRDLLLQRE
ncbi:MAG: carboxypeptidase regulatory-like domain-containing protein, partial [Euryarchaeota archaeon]|nr:carboxypeptidase regulatory-like domain-containing protein [Euryarchaeota archaeon]